MSNILLLAALVFAALGGYWIGIRKKPKKPKIAKKYLVIWSLLTYRDHYVVVDDYDEAVKRYEELLKEDELQSASICVCIESTHYETIPNPFGE